MVAIEDMRLVEAEALIVASKEGQFYVPSVADTMGELKKGGFTTAAAELDHGSALWFAGYFYADKRAPMVEEFLLSTPEKRAHLSHEAQVRLESRTA